MKEGNSIQLAFIVANRAYTDIPKRYLLSFKEVPKKASVGGPIIHTV
jgi:hypothetical protein